MSALTIDPLNARCVVCDRRVTLVDSWVPSDYVAGIVHLRCSDAEVEPEEVDE